MTRCWRCEAELHHPGMDAWLHIYTWFDAIPVISVCANCMIYDWLELELDPFVGGRDWYEDVRRRKRWFTRMCKQLGIEKPDWKSRQDLNALADRIWEKWRDTSRAKAKEASA